MHDSDSPDFATACLRELGLPIGADRRAIQRAYATRLKLIDQSTQIAQFQHLRECYEGALTTAIAHTDPDQEPPEAVAGSDNEQHLIQAHAAIARLRAAMPVPTETTLTNDIVPWVDALHVQLSHDDLLNVDARRAFEKGVASMLTGGWQPGHDKLLPAAALVFEWQDDPKRLRQLGWEGHMLDAALGEQYSARGQTDAELRRQHQALARLRSGDEPDDSVLARDIVYLEQMHERFPNLMLVLTAPARLQLWRERHDTLMANDRRYARQCRSYESMLASGGRSRKYGRESLDWLGHIIAVALSILFLLHYFGLMTLDFSHGRPLP